MGNAPCSTQVFSRCFATALSAVATCDLVIGFISAAHCISFMGKHSEEPGCSGCVLGCTCQRGGRLSSWRQSSAISHLAAATWSEVNLPGSRIKTSAAVWKCKTSKLQKHRGNKAASKARSSISDSNIHLDFERMSSWSIFLYWWTR